MKQSCARLGGLPLAGGGLGHTNTTVRVCKSWEKAELKSAQVSWPGFIWAGELHSVPRLGKFYQCKAAHKSCSTRDRSFPCHPPAASVVNFVMQRATAGRSPEFYGRYLFPYLIVTKRSADRKSCVSEHLDKSTTLPGAWGGKNTYNNKTFREGSSSPFVSIFWDKKTMLCSMHKSRIQALKILWHSTSLTPIAYFFPPPILEDGKAKGQVDEEGASVVGSNKQWSFYQLKEGNGN